MMREQHEKLGEEIALITQNPMIPSRVTNALETLHELLGKMLQRLESLERRA